MGERMGGITAGGYEPNDKINSVGLTTHANGSTYTG